MLFLLKLCIKRRNILVAVEVLTRQLASATSVLLFGSCHLILFVSSTNYIQIVRRQCWLLRSVSIFFICWQQLWWCCHPGGDGGGGGSYGVDTWTLEQLSIGLLHPFLPFFKGWAHGTLEIFKNLSNKSWEVKNFSTCINLRKFGPYLKKYLPHLRKSSMLLLGS